LHLPAIAVAVTTLAFAAHASAQTCRSTAPMKEMRSYQAGGGLAWAEGMKAGVITLVSGDSTAFAVGTYARANYKTVDRASNILTISGGLEVPTHGRSRLVVCPNVTFYQEWGPNDLFDEGEQLGFNRSTTSFNGGLSAGFILLNTSSLMVIPSLNVGLTGVRYDFNFETNQTESGSDHYGLARIAIGVVIARRLSIVPSVDVPFGAAIAQTTAALQVAFSFGGR